MAAGLLMVSGNLLAQNCSVNASPMSFGGLEAASGPAVDSAGNLTVNCDAPASYLIRLDAGLHSNGQFIARKMSRVQGTESMEYNLYRDASRTLIWGDGTGGSSAVQGTNPGFPQTISLYGRIYGGQNLHIGDYTDIVTVTVDW